MFFDFCDPVICPFDSPLFTPLAIENLEPTDTVQNNEIGPDVFYLLSEGYSVPLQSGAPEVPLPPGYEPYASGNYYMQGPDGSVSLTPQWQEQVNAGRIDWVGVGADLGTIIGAGVGILGVWGAAVGMVIVAGSDAIDDMIKKQEELEAETNPKG